MTTSIDDIIKTVGSLNGKFAMAGWSDDLTYPTGEKVAEVAAYLEFGTDRAPPRPFARPTIESEKEKWTELVQHSGDLALLAATMQDDVTVQIATGSYEPLAPLTLALRKKREDGIEITDAVVKQTVKEVRNGTAKLSSNTQPLVDTGRLIASISHGVI